MVARVRPTHSDIPGIDLLRRVGAGVLERHSRLKAVALIFIVGVFVTFVHPWSLDTNL